MEWADKIKHNGNNTISNFLNKLNGWGVLFRFVLPLMIGMLLWNFNTKASHFQMQLADIKTMQMAAFDDREGIKKDIVKYFTNHLSDLNRVADDNKKFQIETEKRLTCIETLLKRK